MYCPSCGVALKQGLSYCNYCGAKLNGEKGDSLVKTTELRAEALTIAGIVGVFVLGLFAITLLMGMMKAVLRFDEGLIIAFAVLSFLIMIVIEGVLIRRLTSGRRSPEEVSEIAASKAQATKELDGAQAAGGALPEPAPSVTDHTTRTLEPVYQERTSK